MLVEVLAYTGDYLSYYQDAVATEAYLDTARQRISVRRHARLVDYILHEGCNARAWVCVEVDTDLSLEASKVSFITSMSDVRVQTENTLTWKDLQDVPDESYEVFEPLVSDRSAEIELLRPTTKLSSIPVARPGVVWKLEAPPRRCSTRRSKRKSNRTKIKLRRALKNKVYIKKAEARRSKRSARLN